MTTDARPLADDTPTCTGAGLDPGPAAPPDETAGELLARLGTDAQAWAAEFVRRFAGETVGETAPHAVDEGLMIGWFANAIETGRSAGMASHGRYVPRDEFDEVCQTLAEMHAAAVGEVRGPGAAGPVKDVANVRARMLAAEEALTAALRNRTATPPDAPGCIDRALEVLSEARGKALDTVSVPDRPEATPLALTAIADAYRDLAVALATHGGLTRRTEGDQ